MLFVAGVVICCASSAVAFDDTVEVHSRTLTDEEFCSAIRMPEVP
jgi:hypothetical protein